MLFQESRWVRGATAAEPLQHFWGLPMAALGNTLERSCTSTWRAEPGSYGNADIHNSFHILHYKTFLYSLLTLPYRASFPLTPSSSCSTKPQHDIFQTQHPRLSITTAAPQAVELLHQFMTAESKSCFTTVSVFLSP